MTDTRKTALITGCSPGGIGFSLAKEFHAKGIRVFATARNTRVLSDLEALDIETLALDVTSPKSIIAAKKEVESLTGGKLDYLVNNAGRSYTVPALDIDMDEVQQTFETNVFGIMRITQQFCPFLIAAKGTIINIGSVAALMPYVFGSVYNSTKAALHAYSSTLRLELAPFGVNVIVVITGGVKSRIGRVQRQLPPGSLYLPINDSYQKRLKYSGEGAMPNESYARAVVSHVLKKRPSSWLWQGNKSYLIWFIDAIFPREVWDYVFPGMFGLDKLAKLVAKSKKRS